MLSLSFLIIWRFLGCICLWIFLIGVTWQFVKVLSIDQNCGSFISWEWGGLGIKFKFDTCWHEEVSGGRSKLKGAGIKNGVNFDAFKEFVEHFLRWIRWVRFLESSEFRWRWGRWGETISWGKYRYVGSTREVKFTWWGEDKFVIEMECYLIIN